VKPLLLVFTKSPAMGRSKTRLARDLGAGQAWRIKRLMDAQTIAVARSRQWETRLVLGACADVTARLPGIWPPPDRLARRLQGPGSLGDRLQRHLRAAGRAGRAVAVIGTDCPQLRRALLATAFAHLSRAGASGAAVAGPAADGGFWLLGLTARLAARISLDGVRWSSASTLDDTLACLPDGVTVRRLTSLRDVDTAADWHAVKPFLLGVSASRH
jgi:uncharacterized protein